MGAILQLVLQNLKIAYVITDHNLSVLKTNGVRDLIDSDGQMNLGSGQSLLDFIPELIGNESILAEILAGKRRCFQLNQINREITPNNINYLTLIILPFRDRTGRITGLIHLIQDVTETATVLQHLVQQRNESRLSSARPG